MLYRYCVNPAFDAILLALYVKLRELL